MTAILRCGTELRWADLHARRVYARVCDRWIGRPGGYFYGRFSCSSSGDWGAFSGITLMHGMAGLGAVWLVMTLLSVV